MKQYNMNHLLSKKKNTKINLLMKVKYSEKYVLRQDKITIIMQRGLSIKSIEQFHFLPL